MVFAIGTRADLKARKIECLRLEHRISKAWEPNGTQWNPGCCEGDFDNLRRNPPRGHCFLWCFYQHHQLTFLQFPLEGRWDTFQGAHTNSPPATAGAVRTNQVHVLCYFFRFCVVNLFVYIWNVSRGFFFCQPVPAQQRRQGGSKMTSSTCIRLHVSHVRKSLSLIQQVPDEKIQQVIEYYSAEAWNRKNQSNLCSRCRPCRSALPWDRAKCPQSPIHEHLETGCLVSIWRHLRHSPRPWAGSQQAEVCFAMILWAWSGPDMTFSVKLPGQDLIHTYMHTCMHTCIHTYIHTDRQTYIHTYTHIHIDYSPNLLREASHMWDHYPREGTPFEDHRCEDYLALHFRFIGSETTFCNHSKDSQVD